MAKAVLACEVFLGVVITVDETGAIIAVYLLPHLLGPLPDPPTPLESIQFIGEIRQLVGTQGFVALARY